MSPQGVRSLWLPSQQEAYIECVPDNANIFSLLPLAQGPMAKGAPSTLFSMVSPFTNPAPTFHLTAI